MRLKVLFQFSLFVFVTNIAIAQNTCCNALSFNTFASYCLADVNPCSAGTAPCDDATFDALFGADNYGGFQCSLPSNVGSNCDGCNSSQVLPVELVSFESLISDEGIRLDWSTASEKDNKGFFLQRSTNGKEWKDLTFIEGNGTTLEYNDYSHMDENPNLGANYYRLRQVDFDDSYEYSQVKVVLWRGGKSNLQLVLIPNPAIESTIPVLPPSFIAGETFTYEVYDLTGKLLLQGEKVLEANIMIDLGSITSGSYVMRIRQGSNNVSANFIKQ